ncbi:MAG: hypothetical protein GY853_05785 [PVC group bacterium]|nr:hypothetical protein [PVC group bacterium]
MITSNAKWSKVANTWDRHAKVTQAEAVCKTLKDFHETTPCPIRGECLDVWVEIDGTRQGTEVCQAKNKKLKIDANIDQTRKLIKQDLKENPWCCG